MRIIKSRPSDWMNDFIIKQSQVSQTSLTPRQQSWIKRIQNGQATISDVPEESRAIVQQSLQSNSTNLPTQEQFFTIFNAALNFRSQEVMNWYKTVKLSEIDKKAGMFEPIPVLEEQIIGWVVPLFEAYQLMIKVTESHHNIKKSEDFMEKLLYQSAFKEKREKFFNHIKNHNLSIDDLKGLTAGGLMKKSFPVDITGWKYAPIVEEQGLLGKAPELSIFEKRLPENIQQSLLRSKQKKSDFGGEVPCEVYIDYSQMHAGGSSGNRIEINFAYSDSVSDIINSCAHEVSHYSQKFLSQFGNQDIRNYGRPERAKDIEEEIAGIMQYREQNEEIHQNPTDISKMDEFGVTHTLDPREFYPNIYGLSQDFISQFGDQNLTNDQLRSHVNEWVNTREEFTILKEQRPDLWQKAVREFYKAVNRI